MAKVKLLYLEHEINDVELVRRQLERDGFDFQLDIAANRAEFEQKLTTCCPDVILADYRMPQFSGMEALALCKEKCPHLPFIFVTGSISEEVAVESLKAGAWDYILKDNLLRLTPAIQNSLKLSQEIRAKEQSQEKLRASEELHRQIFATAADIICLLDAQGTIIEVNRSVQTILGYKPEELMGQSVFTIIGEENQKKAKRVLDEVLNVGRVYNKEFRLFSKERKEIHVIASASLLEHQLHKENLIIAILHDITAYKFLEIQVQKAEKQESLTLLARGIAHDFNNILTVILGNASLLKLTAANDSR